MKKLIPDASISYDPGAFPADAAELARRSDVAIVFATRCEGEGFDIPTLPFPFDQDALIDAVASANRTPSGARDGQSGRDALGTQGEGPFSRPGTRDRPAAKQLPKYLQARSTPPADCRSPTWIRPLLPGFGMPVDTAVMVHYAEGAEVGAP